MIKCSKIFFAALFGFALSSSPAFAGPKFDISRSVQEVMDTISDYAKIAQDKMEELMTVQGKNLLGHAKEAQKAVKSAKKTYDDAKEKYYDPAKATFDEYKEQYDEYKEQYDTFVEENSEYIGYGKDSLELVSLIKKKKKIESSNSAKFAAEESRINGEIAKLDTNIGVYNKQLSSAATSSEKSSIQSKIDQANRQKQTLQNALNTARTSSENSTASETAELDQKIAALEEKLKKSLVKEAGDYASDLFGVEKFDPAAEQAKAAQELFIPQGQKEDAENIDRIRSNRAVASYKDSKAILARAFQIKLGLESSSEIAEDLADTAAQQEGGNAAISVATEVTTEQMKSMINYLETIILELKGKTSGDLVENTKYRLENITTSDGFIDLCAYDYSRSPKALEAASRDLKEGSKQTEADAKALKDALGGFK